ncbi:aspartyl-tRNA synthetase [Eremomyces bilateralis CBS 781.70]|uniref:aspartate--tRNA ligase n=1 Tax=Eremomyces bilateralis CBS 781.70 TaxID=1392243 RepID=A0A6G1FT87_9PEZI|nr:aspartyl-tRNA synthetase [Eremomyces bilateralis CBS 781.70]KAF1808950.1 aspartyl-tRNA synthetase [Eremomyces bilateralis CBS 781.70]
MASLKKALEKIRNGGSQPSSDTEKENHSSVPSSPKRSSTFGLSALHSPRQSGTFSGSSSPRNSGTFQRPNHRESLREKTHSSPTRSPVRYVKDKLHLADDSSSDETEPPLNREGEEMSRNQQRKAERVARKELKKQLAAAKEEEHETRLKEMEEQAKVEETEDMRALYGHLPVNNYAGAWQHEDRLDFESFASKDVGKEVVFRARIHNIRHISNHLTFFELRQQTHTIQGVLQEQGNISKYMMYWANHLEMETVVLVRGILQEPKAKQGEIIGTSIHDIEVAIHSIHAEARIADHMPFTVHEAELSNAKLQEGDDRIVVSDRARIASRILDLRTTASQSIFRIQAGISRLFRAYLDSQGFVEIHTPKLQGGATESGATVFRIDYFGRPAFLAQSPQLAKQMAIASDFRKVYEVGPVFRAENSNTHRHMTEFTGLDLEMAIDEHYHEVLRMLDNTFKAIFEGVYREYRNEIDLVKQHFPHEDLIWIEETPRIPFAEGIRLLNSSGWRDDEGKELPEDEDLGTRDEIQLGKLVKEKYGTDFYILDKFPVGARPFYAMPDPHNPKVTNSFDIFLRGQEILSGGQRIHDHKTLMAQLEKKGIDAGTMTEYLNAFAWGAPPHGGGGIGLERMLFLLLNLGDIRHGSLFPRDPKSFPERPAIKQLRHPEASTMHPPWEGRDRMLAGIEFQPLEELIANYGDATNTSWLEPRTHIWRCGHTGAAVGYVPVDNFAITVGDPLCHESQYIKTISGYLRFINRETKLKPLWVLAGAAAEEILATRFNWRTFSVVAEQRLDPSDVRGLKDNEVARKIRRAEKEGIKITDYALGAKIPDEVRRKVDEKVQVWLANRKGKQVHLTEIRPWQDVEHRSYHFSYTKDGDLVSMVALAQLSPEHGYQVKYALDFPSAPSGSIEMLIGHVFKFVAAQGVNSVTFGGGASSHFTPGHNMRGAKVKVLSKAYHAIMTELKLTNKTEFREKLGAKEEASWVCYPPHGLGPMGVKAIMKFFEDDD